MLNQILSRNYTLPIRLVLWFLACGILFIFGPASNIQNNTKPQIAEKTNEQQISEEITPEGVADLISGNSPFLLINADDFYSGNLSSPGPARLIYYTTTPSFRSAQELVRQDRQGTPSGFLDSSKLKLNSQRLTGTPLKWKRLGLTFLRSPLPTQPQLISTHLLSDAIKDNVDLQVIDLREVMPGDDEVSPFPTAFRWMPHEVLSNLPKLSKEKWIVLVGYSNEGVQPIAWELFQKGYLQTTILDGGYPAWENATDR